MARIAVLIDGIERDFSLAKTGISVARYRRDEIVALIAPACTGQTPKELIGVDIDVPVRAQLHAVTDADTLLIGIAPPGGGFPEAWRSQVEHALRHGMTVIAGLHDFLSEDPAFATIAAEHGGRIEDVRKNRFRQVSTREGLREDCLRVLTVGQDCNCGKMVTSLEATEGLRARGTNVGFVATGQTGIMISGSGLPIDCIVSDFVNGAAEHLVREHQHHDVLLIEGQGSLAQPLYSAVTCGLLHGAMPQAMILCYEVKREYYRHTTVPLHGLDVLREQYEAFASLACPSQVIAVGMNSRRCDDAEAAAERTRVEALLGLPVIDPIRDTDGRERLAEVILAYRERRFASA